MQLTLLIVTLLLLGTIVVSIESSVGSSTHAGVDHRMKMKLRMKGNFTLRRKKTVDQHISRFTVIRQRYTRDLHRYLVFLRRIYLLRRRSKNLKQRIAGWTARWKRLREKSTKMKLTSDWLSHWGNEHGKLGSASSEMRQLVTDRISGLTNAIKLLRVRIDDIKQRIIRAEARRVALQRRIDVLEQRRLRQLKDSRRLFIRATKALVRWRAITEPKVLAEKAGGSNSLEDNADNFLGGKRPTRSRIRRFMKNMSSRIRMDDFYFRRILNLRRQLSKISRRLSELKSQMVSYRNSLQLVTRKFALVQMKQNSRQTVRQLKRRFEHLRVEISRTAEETKLLTDKASLLKAKLGKTIKNFGKNLHQGTSYVRKSGLGAFVQVARPASRAGEKMKGKIAKRKLKHILHQVLLAKDKKLMKKIRRGGDSAGIKAKEHILRSLIKEQDLSSHNAFEVRILKRIARIQQRLQRTARRAGLAVQRQQHILRLRAQLGRRIRRLQDRRSELDRRIRAAETRARHLVRQRQQLAIQPKSGDKSPNGTGRTEAQQLVRIDHEIAKCKSNAAKLRLRRILIERRLLSIWIRRHRLNYRLVTLKHRIRGLAKRLKMLMEKKRSFVKRMRSHRLVSGRAVRLVAEPSRSIIKHLGGRRVLKVVAKDAGRTHAHAISL